MRFHVVSLPHTNVTPAFSACAYTEKVRKFCLMMAPRGHTVYLYAGTETTAPCHELVTCISEADRQTAVRGSDHYVNASWDNTRRHWRVFNAAAAEAIRARYQPGDFLCVIGGLAHKPIADAVHEAMAVEFGIGYGGTFARFRVWESYAWMHTCYGSGARNPHELDGHWFDAVIPNYFDPSDFPFRSRKSDYVLYVGRMIDRKGIHTATQVCATAGARLVMAGPGTPPAGVEYAGVIGPAERGKLMSEARALIAPTHYIEPFGGVAVEAMLCGTPVIATDWGAFTETVVPGVTGFRCRMARDFVHAIEHAADLEPRRIRQHALRRYSLKAVAPQYEAYFERLSTLYGAGWYAR